MASSPTLLVAMNQTGRCQQKLFAGLTLASCTSHVDIHDLVKSCQKEDSPYNIEIYDVDINRTFRSRSPALIIMSRNAIEARRHQTRRGPLHRMWKVSQQQSFVLSRCNEAGKVSCCVYIVVWHVRRGQEQTLFIAQTAGRLLLSNSCLMPYFSSPLLDSAKDPSVFVIDIKFVLVTPPLPRRLM